MEINIKTFEGDIEYAMVTANGTEEAKFLLEKVLDSPAAQASPKHCTVEDIIKILQAIESHSASNEGSLQELCWLVKSLSKNQKIAAIGSIRALTGLTVRGSQDLYEGVFFSQSS
ncbi:hypothetical protein LCGC14_0479590 [marine sediment metagenome]|uniref:Uncharacterized protein n=1 Tax=marine sediment metagenome TaxID=412755 RepID=A0A0F9VIH0_9ZZZZ